MSIHNICFNGEVKNYCKIIINAQLFRFSVELLSHTDCNDPKFSDRQAWAQIRLFLEDQVYTVYHSVCIFWTHYSMVEPQCLIFRIIIAIFLSPNI